jgi:hypothetical protein
MKSTAHFHIFLYINNTVFAAILLFGICQLIVVSLAIRNKESVTLLPSKVTIKKAPLINTVSAITANNSGAVQYTIDTLGNTLLSNQIYLDLQTEYKLNKAYTIFNIVRFLLATLAILLALYRSFLVLDDVRKERDITKCWPKNFKWAGRLFLIAAILLAVGLNFTGYFQDNWQQIVISQSSFYIFSIPSAICLLISLFFSFIATIKPMNA